MHCSPPALGKHGSSLRVPPPPQRQRGYWGRDILHLLCVTCFFSFWFFLHKDVVMQFHYLVFKQGLWRYEDIESQLSVHLRDDLLCKQQRQPVGCRQLVLACSTVTSSTYGCQQVVGHLRWYHFGSPVWKVFWMMSVCMQAPLIPSCKG